MVNRWVAAGAVSLAVILGAPQVCAQTLPAVVTEQQSFALRGRVAELSEMLFQDTEYGRFGAVQYSDGLYAVISYTQGLAPIMDIDIYPEPKSSSTLETIFFSGVDSELATMVNLLIRDRDYRSAAILLLRTPGTTFDAVVYDLLAGSQRIFRVSIPDGSRFQPSEDFTAPGGAYDRSLDLMQQAMQDALLGN